MVRCCALVMGPAGTGKSTFCHTIQGHCAAGRRKMHVANLDPAAEDCAYEVAFDIRDMISVEGVMETMGLGPNGALVYCMEHLVQNSEWLRQRLDEYADDEFVLLDCPGQIELYSHIPVMHEVARMLHEWDVRACGVYLLDALFVAEPSKFISGCLLSLSCMLAVELPHVNMLTKCDLIDSDSLERVLNLESASLIQALDAEGMFPGSITPPEPPRNATESASSADPDTLLQQQQQQQQQRQQQQQQQRMHLRQLTSAISEVVDDFSIVNFLPVNPNDEDTVALALANIEHLTQFSENVDVREDDYDLAGGGGGAGDPTAIP